MVFLLKQVDLLGHQVETKRLALSKSLLVFGALKKYNNDRAQCCISILHSIKITVIYLYLINFNSFIVCYNNELKTNYYTCMAKAAL